MRKIKLHISVSIDGYIAHSDGDLDWLLQFSSVDKEGFKYQDFIDSIDIILMGNETYKEINFISVDWPYKNKLTYILTRYTNNIPPKENVTYITDNVIQTILNIKKQKCKDIWLIGGGQTITFLLNHNLIDEMQIYYIPVILGKGIPLFTQETKESRWIFTGNTVYNSGIVRIDYTKSD